MRCSLFLDFSAPGFLASSPLAASAFVFETIFESGLLALLGLVLSAWLDPPLLGAPVFRHRLRFQKE